MNLFQNISWADFLMAAIPLLIIFNAAVFVYYRNFYKGDKESTPKDKKFDNDTTSSSFEVEDEDEDVTFVSYDDEADEDDYVQKDPDDVEETESGSEEGETTNEFDDVNADMFFADGEVLDDKYREDVEMAFQELGYTSQEGDMEGVDFCDDDNLYEASIKAFNVQKSEIDEIDDVFLGIVEKLEEIQEKSDEEQFSMSDSPSVDDDFFGSELEDDLNV